MKIPSLDQLYILKAKTLNKLGADNFFKKIFALGITPNIITSINLVIGFTAVYFLFEDQKLFAIIFLANRLIDGLDGYMARNLKITSELGDKLDHWGDVAITIALFLKTILFSEFYLLGVIALIVYICEYVLLKSQNQLKFKFPTSMFAFIYVFGYYELALWVQILYQTFSYIYFQWFLREKRAD